VYGRVSAIFTIHITGNPYCRNFAVGVLPGERNQRSLIVVLQFPEIVGRLRPESQRPAIGINAKPILARPLEVTQILNG